MRSIKKMVKKQETPSDMKKYLWVILYLVLIFIGQKLAGIGGSIGAIIISFGISKTVRNPDLSKTKKWVYSILYIIAGIAVAAVIVIIILGAFNGFNLKTHSSASSEFKTYSSANMEIGALSYPADWIVLEEKDKYAVTFTSPDSQKVIAVAYAAAPAGMILNLSVYTANLLKEDQADSSYSLNITNEEIKNINGKDFLIFNSLRTTGKTYTTYEKNAILVTNDSDGAQQIFNFVLGTYSAISQEESAVFDKVLDSFRVSS